MKKKIREREKNACVAWGSCLKLKKKSNQSSSPKSTSPVFNIHSGDNSMSISWKKTTVFKFSKNCLKVTLKWAVILTWASC